MDRPNERGFGRSSGRGGKGRDITKGKGLAVDERSGFDRNNGGFGSSRDDGGFGRNNGDLRDDGGFGDGGFVGTLRSYQFLISGLPCGQVIRYL